MYYTKRTQSVHPFCGQAVIIVPHIYKVMSSGDLVNFLNWVMV
jgi:hypothetical protein